MKQGLRVLSLFDGMSCGLTALKRAGIPIEQYWASEIDKYAIQIAKKNHPEILQLGDINNWKDWEFPAGYFDLIIGGSPCQGFSIAGKGLNFDDSRSKLYFEFEEILKTYKPRFWLLENVRMKKQWQEVITERLEVKPMLINSALVSAQNRERLYWANFEITQPEDRGILLKDIVLSDVFPVALDGLRGKNGCFNEGFPRVSESKSPTLRTPSGGGNIPSFVLSEKELVYMNKKVKDGRTHWDFQHHSDIERKKSSCLVVNFFKGVPYNVLRDMDCVRKFHPIECERLQNLPDNYTEGVSNTQRYKMIGNGWTIDVIAHIFNCMQKNF